MNEQIGRLFEKAVADAADQKTQQQLQQVQQQLSASRPWTRWIHSFNAQFFFRSSQRLQVKQSVRTYTLYTFHRFHPSFPISVTK